MFENFFGLNARCLSFSWSFSFGGRQQSLFSRRDVESASFFVPWPPGSPHPVRITLSSLLSPYHVPQPFTDPDLKLISFTNPFFQFLVSSGLPSRILNLYRTKWALACGCFSFFFYFFLVTCARLSWQRSAFLVHVLSCCILVVSVALLVARRTNNRKTVGSMPANVVCITADR